MSNVGPKKRKPGKNSIGIRRFVDDEFDSWVRPWIQAVKCVPEYAAEWDALAAKCSATNFSAGASLARATFGNRLPPKPEPSRSLWHLAVRWKLPTGPVSPSALDDFGAELDGDLIRQYRLWQRPETAAREVNFYQCVDELAPIFKKFENEFDGPEERRRAELALVATLFVMQTGGQPPLWPVKPILRVDIDLEQPNTEVSRALDSIRKLYRIPTDRRPRRSIDSWRALSLGFAMLHDRQSRPTRKWSEVERDHMSRHLSVESRHRMACELRKRATLWIDRVRREILGDETGLPWPHYGEPLLKHDGDAWIERRWLDPRRDRRSKKVCFVARKRRRSI